MRSVLAAERAGHLPLAGEVVQQSQRRIRRFLLPRSLRTDAKNKNETQQSTSSCTRVHVFPPAQPSWESSLRDDRFTSLEY